MQKSFLCSLLHRGGVIGGTLNIDDISLFTRTAIPQDVVNGSVSMTTRGEEIYMLDRFF